MPWLWVLVQTCPGDLHLPPGVYLVGGLEMFGTCFMTFHSVGNFIIPTDFHSIILQMGRYTTNRLFIWIFRSRVSIFRGAPDGPSEKILGKVKIRDQSMDSVVWNMFYFSICWKERSQVIFFRGDETSNHYIYIYIYTHVLCLWLPYVQCIKPNMFSSKPSMTFEFAHIEKL